MSLNNFIAILLHHVSIADVHIPKKNAEKYWKETLIHIVEKVNGLDFKLLTLNGDTSDAYTEPDSEAKRVLLRFVMALREIAYNKGASFRILVGTKTHDSTTLDDLLHLETLSEYRGSNPAAYASKLLGEIDDSIGFIKDIETTFKDIAKYLEANASTLSREIELAKDMGHYDFRIISKPTLETLRGLNFLWLPELYGQFDMVYSKVKEIINNRPIDICVFHGMVEGCVPYIDNRPDIKHMNTSFIIPLELLENVKYYSTGGHIHNSMYVGSSGKVWYTGNITPRCYADTDKKGFDYISIYEGSDTVDRKRILNDHATQYMTLDITEELLDTKNHKRIIHRVESMLEIDHRTKIRLDIDINTVRKDYDANGALMLLQSYLKDKVDFKFKVVKDEREYEASLSKMKEIEEKEDDIPQLLLHLLHKEKGMTDVTLEEVKYLLDEL